MDDFLKGVLVMSAATVGLFFLRFWRRTQDRLFLAFAGAFWLLALNWLLLVIIRTDEKQPALYAIRIVAFALIIAGVWSKNGPRAVRKVRVTPLD
jgi:hypothetical protein